MLKIFIEKGVKSYSQLIKLSMAQHSIHSYPLFLNWIKRVNCHIGTILVCVFSFKILRSISHLLFVESSLNSL